MARNKREGKEMAVKDIVNKKRGRPLLLGSELDKRVQAFLNTLRTRLNALSNQWAKYLLHCMVICEGYMPVSL